ncbi:NUDIX hydrolase [Pedobacter cryoconitis]|uniref:ADP-ribose pyrophosphatase YjhB (NUDIX family) n=1 Tax=Pedobacter cryoconitis TaxID=188932 RepID=A0A327SF98_9SPHI|nr:NUDIX domain-containing protein [Pedobacter cryoconitis]RAJ26353.1 ADP-ribose pyrophosphatase YjhB (NUDIX family) [Pedobacter cryoconitis]
MKDIKLGKNKKELMNKEIRILHTAGLVVIKEGKILLAFSGNKKAWYLPGGKIDSGETSHQAVQREIYEELDIKMNPDLLTFYCHITAPAFGEENNLVMEQDCFIYNLTETIAASNEIDEVGYFDLEAYLKEPAQVPGVLTLFAKLEEDGLLNSVLSK